MCRAVRHIIYVRGTDAYERKRARVLAIEEGKKAANTGGCAYSIIIIILLLFIVDVFKQNNIHVDCASVRACTAYMITIAMTNIII